MYLSVKISSLSILSPLLCSGVIVCLGSHKMVCTVDLGDSNLFSTGLPSFTFLPPLLFVYLHSNLLPQNPLFRLRADYTQMGYCGPHPCSSSDDLMFWAELSRTIGSGIATCFGGAFSTLGLSYILMKVGIGISFPFRGISQDLATSKFVQAGTVFGDGVSCIVSGMAAEAVAGALGCKGIGCCSLRGLFRLGINGASVLRFEWQLQ